MRQAFTLFFLVTLNSLAQKDTALMIAEKMPEFPGGTQSIIQHIAQSFNENMSEGVYYQGKVYIRFIVNNNGKVIQPEILKSSGNDGFDNLAVMTIENMPDWIPGIDSGKPVSVYINLPICVRGFKKSIAHKVSKKKSPKSKALFSPDDLKNCPNEVKSQKTFYLNGQLMRDGSFRVYTTNQGVWAVPVNRHVTFRRNGKIKIVSTYSKHGLPISDSIFKKNGRIRKIKIHNVVSIEQGKNAAR